MSRYFCNLSSPFQKQNEPTAIESIAVLKEAIVAVQSPAKLNRTTWAEPASRMPRHKDAWDKAGGAQEQRSHFIFYSG